MRHFPDGGGGETGTVMRRKKTHSVANFNGIFYYITHTKSTMLLLSINIVRQMYRWHGGSGHSDDSERYL